MRLSATKSLIERRDVVIVATVSCIYGIGDRDEYHNMIPHHAGGDKLDQRAIVKAPAEMRTSATTWISTGAFRVRGDVIDIFPRARRTRHPGRAVRRRGRNLQFFDPLTGHLTKGPSTSRSFRPPTT